MMGWKKFNLTILAIFNLILLFSLIMYTKDAIEHRYDNISFLIYLFLIFILGVILFFRTIKNTNFYNNYPKTIGILGIGGMIIILLSFVSWLAMTLNGGHYPAWFGIFLYGEGIIFIISIISLIFEFIKKRRKK